MPIDPKRPRLLAFFFLSVAALSLSLLGWIAIVQGDDADELRGAATLLDELSTNDEGEGPAEVFVDPGAEAMKQFLAFQEARLKLEPEAAATQWLEMTRQGMAEPHGFLSFSDYVMALPGPDAWPALAEQINALPVAGPGDSRTTTLVLQVFSATLLNDQDAAAAAMKQLDWHAVTLPVHDRADAQQALATLQAAVDREAEVNNDLSEPAARDRVIARALREYKEWGGLEEIAVPSLVSQIGEEQAAAFFKKAMAQPVLFDFDNAEEATLKLGQKVMLELGDKLAAPQWSLVSGEGTIKLYVHLSTRFNAPAPADLELDAPQEIEELKREIAKLRRSNFGSSWRLQSQHETAEGRYLMALAKSGETEKFKAALVGKIAAIDGDESSSFSYRFFDDELAMELAWPIIQEMVEASEKPSAALWALYATLGTDLGKSDEMLEALDGVFTEHADFLKANPQTHADLLCTRYEALLSADRLEDAVAALREALVNWPEDPDVDRYDNPGQTLAELGRLMDEPAWIEEGLSWMVKPAWGVTYHEEVAELYEQVGQLAEAERLLHDNLKLRVAKDVKQDPRRHYSRYDSPDTVLISLGAFYHRAGRDSDALHLIENAPWWTSEDLSDLIQNQGYSDDMADLAAGAANTLAKAGQKNQAVAILRAMIAQSPDNDTLYEPMVAIMGEAALAELDKIYQRDQFEERPLIWKAHALNQLERYAQAAEVAKKAISIDPSDGDQGKGDRMRVYAVLADALAGQGNAEDAAFYREVVAAIRMSEDADDYYSVGLTRRAAQMYQQALQRFADAYCIQSRLAIRLYDMGWHEEAAEHFRKAFELMPDSFGRVESHCFGCEGVFSTELAKHIAEEVFLGLVQEQPDKPQVHYLMGYLRSSQDQDEQALKHYRRAVELDPDYVNAWRKISYSSIMSRLDAEAREEVVFNLLRLDLDSVLRSGNTENVYDLARLWELAQRALDSRPVVPESLLQLGPDREKDEAEQEEEAVVGFGRGSIEEQFYSIRRRYHEIEDPAMTIARHRVVEAIDGWLNP